MVTSWFFNEKNKPDYVGMHINEGLIKIYEIDEKYQCPRYCDVNHIHKTHYSDKKCDKCNHFIVKKNEKSENYKLYIQK